MEVFQIVCDKEKREELFQVTGYDIDEILNLKSEYENREELREDLENNDSVSEIENNDVAPEIERLANNSLIFNFKKIVQYDVGEGDRVEEKTYFFGDEIEVVLY
ncbi:MAG: hypothetical protein ACRC31_08025 [Cetobacterium sp.]